MTSNELKSLVKEYFNLVEAEVSMETTEETFGELKDINGAFTIKFPGDSLQIGDKVTVVTAEGQEMGAPDGTHELEDGTKIVTKDSVVEEITSANDEKEMAEEEVSKEVVSEEETMEEIVVEVEEGTPSLEEVVKEIAEAVAEQMKSIETKMAKLEAKMAKFEETPAAEPTVTSTGKEIKSGFSKFDVTSAKNSKDMELALRMIKKNKK